MNANRNTPVTALSRAVTAEIRAQMGAQRISGNQLAKLAGMSQNYLATRLRDEKPFDLDDIEKIAHFLDDRIDAHQFILRAYENHGELAQEDVMLAARDTSDDEESEAQQQEP